MHIGLRLLDVHACCLDNFLHINRCHLGVILGELLHLRTSVSRICTQIALPYHLVRERLLNLLGILLALLFGLLRLRHVVVLPSPLKRSRVFGNGMHIGLRLLGSHVALLDHFGRQRLLMLDKIFLARLLGHFYLLDIALKL